MLYKDRTSATEPVYTTKVMLGGERVIRLKKREGVNGYTNTGMIDNRMFTGENKLRAVRDEDSSLWSMKYDSGVIPVQLRQKFTSFSKLFDYAKQYFDKRNVDIEEDYGQFKANSEQSPAAVSG